MQKGSKVFCFILLIFPILSIVHKKQLPVFPFDFVPCSYAHNIQQEVNSTAVKFSPWRKTSFKHFEPIKPLGQRSLWVLSLRTSLLWSSSSIYKPPPVGAFQSLNKYLSFGRKVTKGRAKGAKGILQSLIPDYPMFFFFFKCFFSTTLAVLMHSLLPSCATANPSVFPHTEQKFSWVRHFRKRLGQISEFRPWTKFRPLCLMPSF